MGNREVEFPEMLEDGIARITGGFSFAYIQEAFVAALLAIANEDDEDGDDVDAGTSEGMKGLDIRMMVGDDDDLEQYVLWREIKKAVRTLREELESEKGKPQ